MRLAASCFASCSPPVGQEAASDFNNLPPIQRGGCLRSNKATHECRRGGSHLKMTHFHGIWVGKLLPFFFHVPLVSNFLQFDWHPRNRNS